MGRKLEREVAVARREASFWRNMVLIAVIIQYELVSTEVAERDLPQLLDLLLCLYRWHGYWFKATSNK